MSYLLRTINNPAHRKELFDRFERLDPAQDPLWGRMSAPRMLAHLCDQMRLPFRDRPCTPVAGPMRNPVLRRLIFYVLPWPKAKVQGPPEAFETEPGAWSEDLATLKELVDRFGNAPPEQQQWPDHPIFGRMSRRDWGAFTYRHFDHHLRQFGV